MGLTTALAALAAVAGIGGVAAQGMPVTATAAASLTPAASQPVATPGSSSSARCDDGRWVGPDGVNINGRPGDFNAGDRGAVYLWHGADGWRLRTTDISGSAHHYTGAIALSAGARFTSFSTARLENGDRAWVDGGNVLHYDFTTHNGIDGLNFTVSACDAPHGTEMLRFSMDYNGREDDPSRINLGESKRHPDSASFAVTRSV